MFKTQCDQCYKTFESDGDQTQVERSLRAHINRTGHDSAILVEGAGSEEGEPIVATEAPVKEQKQAKAEKVSAEEKAAARAKVAEAKQAAREADRASRPCECGCGGVPKGFKSRFIPGHDAKLASAEKSAEA